MQAQLFVAVTNVNVEVRVIIFFPDVKNYKLSVYYDTDTFYVH